MNKYNNGSLGLGEKNYLKLFLNGNFFWTLEKKEHMSFL
jgi:hypothetical protein